MTRAGWVMAAGTTLLLAVIASLWRENHQPWQAWQALYNSQPNVTPSAIRVHPLVPAQTGKPELCLTCHLGIEDISSSHPAETFGCIVCHGGDPLALDAGRAHSGLRGGRNPSDLSIAKTSCGTTNCHGGFSDAEQNHVDRVLRSLQATYAGGLALVRYTFGAQTSPVAQTGIRTVLDNSKLLPAKTLTALKEFSPTTASHPSEAKVQQNCLTGGCHLWTAPAAQPYYYRGTGCSACHYLYADDGLYRGQDPTIPRDEPGHGVAHRLTTAIPFTQCNHCHNRGNYSLKQMSFLARDDLPPAAAPLSSHMPPEGRRLIEYYQPIAEFAKCEYELNCADCHTSGEVMGDGHIYGAKKDAQYVQCQTCHGTPTSIPKTKAVGEVNELAMRQARLAGRPDYLKVGDRVVQTERDELLWSVKETAPGKFSQIEKETGQVYKVPQVKGSKCEQDGRTQTADYCHQCHQVTR